MTSSTLEYGYVGTEPAWDYDIVLPTILDVVKSVPDNGSILDIGCGNGAILGEIRTRGTWRLYGIEISQSGAEIARSQGFDVRVADATNNLVELFGPNTFDLIISVEVIEHVYDTFGLLKQVHSILRPNGMLLLTTPYHGYLKNLVIALTGKCNSHYNPLWACGHIKFWSKQTLSAALEQSGYFNISFEGAGRIPFLWKSMILRAKKAAD